MIAAEKRQEIVKASRRHDSDSGSPEVQVAVLTQRIGEITEHLRGHSKDYSSRRGLIMMVGKRNRLLKYLARVDNPRYQDLIRRLGLRK
jgi:small subunit ribosomal protein S15